MNTRDVADSPRFTTAIVLAAGASSRLGQPKQLLEFRGRPLLQAVVDMANAGPFSQVLVTIGGAAPEVRDQIDFGRSTPVENMAFTTGCSSSIVAALDEVDVRSRGVVLLLGDQPGVTMGTVQHLLDVCFGDPIGVCRYDDGIGHPFWIGRQLFHEVRGLSGDKGIWKLIESGTYDVSEIRRPGPVPPDVDTWEDYERLLQMDR